MKEQCLSRNPLIRDGSSQAGRILNTLLPSYVSVDERSMKDLLSFAQKFSEEIVYFNNSNVPDGDWQEFFQLTTESWETFSLEDYLEKLKVYRDTKPHWALFFSFLYLLKIAQDDLNTITKRHLDFYYRDVLQLKENPAVADQVTIIFKLAKHVSEHLIKKGTVLKAGKDASGVELFYKVEKDVVINKAQVLELRSIFANINDRLPDATPLADLEHRIFASPIANSADGLGAELETAQQDWRTFGRPQIIDGTPDPIIDRTQGDLGFALASPQLFMAEGTRKLSLTFSGANFPATTDNPFLVYFSGEEAWLEAEVKIISPDTIEASLKPDQAAVVAYNAENLLDPFQTRFPVVKILLNKSAGSFFYKSLINEKFTAIKIKVDVSDVRQLVLQNDQSVLDAGKPFQPFTNRPIIGSNFYIGSWEVFQKRLTNLSLNISWSELPANLKNYYGFAEDPTATHAVYNENLTQDIFKVDITTLESKAWESIKPANQFPLFTGPINIPNPVGILRDTNLAPLKKFDVLSQKGFIRMRLEGLDFGHKEYPNIYAQQAMRIAKNPELTNNSLPNIPYTPAIETLSIDYTSEEDFTIGLDQFFHIEPFGLKESITDDLLPAFENEGNLYLGIENLNPPQNLSLHFQVAEGSANPDRERQIVNWHYLSENSWQKLEQNQVLSDTTNGLLTSGIIQFDIPKSISKENTLLPGNLHWLRLSVREYSDAICRLIDVKAQALTAKFSDNNNDANHLAQALPAGTISKLFRSDAGVDKIMQPYHSFGGKLQESSTAFYTRVSERLRHKNRAITMWDYERLILQAFPEVYKVKCINHTKFIGTLTDYSELKPGHVTILIVSNVQNKNAVDPLRPKTSLILLTEIEQFIKKIAPPCIQLFVKNPIYESVAVNFKVKFRPGIDKGFFLKKLNEEIRFFLSPWASDCAKDIVFGGKIHKSMVLNFVEERSYVDYVTCFEMYHDIPGDPTNNPNKDIDEATASRAVSILGSADEHRINIIELDEDCACDDNEIKSTNRLLALGDTSC